MSSPLLLEIAFRTLSHQTHTSAKMKKRLSPALNGSHRTGFWIWAFRTPGGHSWGPSLELADALSILIQICRLYC